MAAAAAQLQKMNNLSFSELCCLFCCPPCPGKIASKLAFLPPDPTYTLMCDESGSRWTLHLSERADWQYSSREKDAIECFMTRTSKGNRIACMFVRCSPNAKYTLLFSHGNAVDLGQMSSFLHRSGVPGLIVIYSHMITLDMVLVLESQQRRTCMQTWKLPGWLFGQDTAFVLKM